MEFQVVIQTATVLGAVTCEWGWLVGELDEWR